MAKDPEEEDTGGHPTGGSGPREDAPPVAHRRPRRAPVAAGQQRILQFNGKRLSLRLEPAFWDALEASADRRRTRLNRLVADLAQRMEPGGNLASALRVHCLRDVEGLAQARAFAADRTSVLALVDSAPAPCLVLGNDQRIAAVNGPFVTWVGRSPEDLVGDHVLRHFRFRGNRSLEELWRGLGRHWSLPEASRIINIEPGRVLAANVRLVPVLTGRERPACLVWVIRENRRG